MQEFFDLALSDAPQGLRSAQEQLAIRDRNRAQTIIVHIVFRQHFELGAGFDHRSHAILIGDVDFAIGQSRRRAVRP